MFRQPIFTIARITTSLLLRSSGINYTIARTITSSTFGLVSQIYSQSGFITSFQAIYHIFNFIRRGIAINANILTNTFVNIHPEIADMFITYLLPHWQMLLQHRYRLLFTLFSISGTTIITLIKPFWFIRLVLGTILSSLGILWHETLSTYSYLKKGALYVVDLLNSYGFIFPIPSTSDIINNNSNYPSIYTVAGVLLLGTIGIALSIILLEYYIPPINEPVLSYSERLYNLLHLQVLSVWFETVNEVLYNYYPPIYNYFFTPISKYLIVPTWKYGISMPFNLSYDYIFHPVADGIRYIYDFFYYKYYTYTRDDQFPHFPSPPTSPSVGSEGGDIVIKDNRTQSSGGGTPASMSDSIVTTKPDVIIRKESNNPYFNNTYGMFTKGQSSNTKLEDMANINNPFNQN